MKIVTANLMRELDRAAIEGAGIPSQGLMETAGAGLAALVRKATNDEGPVAVICGRGNNGGDGFVAARLLKEAGVESFVVLTAEPQELSPDARENFEKFKGMGGRILSGIDEAAKELAGAACIVDAMLGTGLARDVEGKVLRAIELINSIDVPVIACDLPSGLNADTGLPMGDAVVASNTVTFGLPKIGLYAGQGPNFAGRIAVVDIGIPAGEIAKLEASAELIEPAMFADVLVRRRITGHKGSYGHVAVFAGAGGHLGAGYLSSLAALRAGCGLSTYCLPDGAFAKFDARYPEIMCDPIPDGGKGHFTDAGLAHALKICAGKNAVAIGPAIGTDDDTKSFVNSLVRDCELPLVIDADGLGLLELASIEDRKAPTVLTPHPGEMGRLLGISSAEVQGDRIGVARRLTTGSGAWVILKGAGTVVAAPDGETSINPTGNPGMATAGMGDALTGIVASFLAQGIGAHEACKAAVYLHGLAGDIAAEELGQASVIASDIIERIGKAVGTTVRQYDGTES